MNYDQPHITPNNMYMKKYNLFNRMHEIIIQADR